MNLAEVPRAGPVRDLIVEQQTGDASVDFYPADAGDPNPIGLAGIACDTRRLEDPRRKP